MKKLLLIFGLFAAITYGQEHSFDPEEVVNRSISAHGSKVFEANNVSFDFRNKSYTIQPTSNGYRYTRSQILYGANVKDIMTQRGAFTRQVNGKTVEVTDSTAFKFSESINSVAYFFMLPLPLNDQAVIKEAAGMDTIAGKVYYRVAVTFRQEGGGTDFQDQYRYWIDKDNYRVDYLAYNYQTNGGGVRFRKAINRRKIEGLVVQDYINYRPKDIATPLDSLPSLFGKGELIEVSRIEKTNIQVESTKKP